MSKPTIDVSATYKLGEMAAKLNSEGFIVITKYTQCLVAKLSELKDLINEVEHALDNYNAGSTKNAR